jgi:hypothetical protein
VAAVLVEPLVEEGAVADDSNDPTDFLLLLVWDAFVLFGHSDGVFVSMVSTFHTGNGWLVHLRPHEGALYERNLHSIL